MSSDGSYSNDEGWDGEYDEEPNLDSSLDLVRYVKLPVNKYEKVSSCRLLQIRIF